MMDNKTTISFNSQNNDMMTGGAQARLRPSLIPHFPKEIYKMKNGMKEKRGEHVKNVKRLAGQEKMLTF